MRNMHIMAAVIAFCCLCMAVIAMAQTADSCANGILGICPPSGTEMGQSNYQRTPHPNVYETPRYETTTPLTPLEATPEQETVGEEPVTEAIPADSGIGPLTAPLASKITVDDNYIYVMQGDEVVKLDKKDLHVVARTKISNP